MSDPQKPDPQYRKHKLAFMKYGMLVFGVPAAFLIWLVFGKYGDAYFQLFLVVFMLGCSWVWSLAVWHLLAHGKPDPETEDEGKE